LLSRSCVQVIQRTGPVLFAGLFHPLAARRRRLMSRPNW
jgi:hypothetical protein